MRDFLPVLFKAGNVSKNNGTVKMRGHQKDKNIQKPNLQYDVLDQISSRTMGK